MHAIPVQTTDFLARRLDAARDLYLLAMGTGKGGSHQFGSLIQEARLHFINVIEEARAAGLDTLAIQNLLANHNALDSRHVS